MMKNTEEREINISSTSLIHSTMVSIERCKKGRGCYIVLTSCALIFNKSSPRCHIKSLFALRPLPLRGCSNIVTFIVCLSVASRVFGRPLAKERIPNIGLQWHNIKKKSFFSSPILLKETPHPWSRCYYPHRSRYSVSPVCGICILKLSFVKMSYLS